jgi:hypothetical protein
MIGVSLFFVGSDLKQVCGRCRQSAGREFERACMMRDSHRRPVRRWRRPWRSRVDFVNVFPGPERPGSQQGRKARCAAGAVLPCVKKLARAGKSG